MSISFVEVQTVPGPYNRELLSSSLCMTSSTPSSGVPLQCSTSASDLYSHAEWTNIQGKPKVFWKIEDRCTCVPLADNGEIVGPSKDFNFIVSR